MSAYDYTFDPTGEAPSHYIEHEVHPLTATVGVFPLHGPFFVDTLVVEGSLDGINYVPLKPRLDYRQGPLFMRYSASLGREVSSYFIVQREWRHIRINYQLMGSVEDDALLTEVMGTVFDRKDPAAWLKIRGKVVHDPSAFDRQWRGLGEAEAVNQGLEAIRRKLEELPGQGDKATLQQVTALEMRQSEVESLIQSAEGNVGDIMEGFTDLWELYHVLEDYFVNGGQGNTAYPEGYLYNSEGLFETHLVQHNLDTDDLHLDFWMVNEQDVLVPIDGEVEILNANTVRVLMPVPRKVLGVIRPAGPSGFVFTSPAGAPESTYTVDHELDSGYLGISVWRWDGVRWWLAPEAVVTTVSNQRYVVSLTAPAPIKVVIEPPTPNAFAFKSQPEAIEHIVTHYLGTHYVVATVWQETETGEWTTQGANTLALSSVNHLKVALADARNIKVVLHPVGLQSVNFDQDILTKQVEIEDTQQRIEQRLDQVNQAIALLSIETTFEYDSLSPSMVHSIAHNLDSFFVDATVWVKDDDGDYQIEYPTINIVDNNHITISLTTSNDVHVCVRRAGQ